MINSHLLYHLSYSGMSPKSRRGTERGQASVLGSRERIFGYHSAAFTSTASSPRSDDRDSAPCFALATARRGEARPIAIITGASSGIGRELAELFARDGHDLILVARRRDALESIARIARAIVTASPATRSLPISRGGSSASISRRAFEPSISTIAALVNNAGIGTHGYFHETDLERELEIIELNIAALTHLTKLVLPGMLRAARGPHRERIVGRRVPARAAHVGVLRVEGVRAVVLRGAVAKRVADTRRHGDGGVPGPNGDGVSDARRDCIRMRRRSARQLMTSREVAELAYRARRSGKRVVVTGFATRSWSWRTGCSRDGA